MNDGRLICLIADGTGNEVPCAFMSLIGIHLIKNCLRENPYAELGMWLEQLHLKVLASLNASEKESVISEGMDAGIVIWHPQDKTLNYAGAARPLVYQQQGKLQVLKFEKFTIVNSELNSHKSLRIILPCKLDIAFISLAMA